MNGISPIALKPQVNLTQRAQVAFKGDADSKFDPYVEAGEKVLKGATTKPNEDTIKAGLSALVAVVGVFLTKNAKKIEAFVQKNSNSPNKFIKAVAVVAGLLMSVLGALGATSIFKDKITAPESEKTPEKVETPPPVVEKEDGPPADSAVPKDKQD